MADVNDSRDRDLERALGIPDEVEEEEDDGDEKDLKEAIYPSVKEMHIGAVDLRASSFDFGEGYGERWEFQDSDTCSECAKRLLITSPGEQRHYEVNYKSKCRGYVSSEGPMMNFIYPLPWKNYDAKLLRGPLCLVTYDSEGGGEHKWGLALMGGGMDLTWEICEAYMRLNYLPPASFAATLPSFAGCGVSERDQWIIAACRESARVVMRDTRRTLARLKTLEDSVKQKKS